MDFRISVIIPVYNAERFIAKAVRSAMQQIEVSEIVVINDGSTDRTLTILYSLKKEDERLKILEHSGGRNLGRSASRNLGIRVANMPFIAFLDADDYFLPARFERDKEVFLKYPDADGVYNAIGGISYDVTNTSEEAYRETLTTLRERVSPEALFYSMWPKGTMGHFSGDGLILKKEVFEKIDPFNEALEVAEDTELYIRMSLRLSLYPGILDRPVSVRGIHEKNVIKKIGSNLYNRNYFKMYKNLLSWGTKENLPIEVLDYFWERLDQYYRILNSGEKGYFIKKGFFWFDSALKYPDLLKTRRFWRTSPFYRLKINI